MNSIEKIIKCFRKFPSVGPKQAERFAMYVMKSAEEEISELVNSIIEVKSTIKQCSKCYNYTSNEVCDICSDKNRDPKTICIVENPFDIIAIEKTGIYNGLYFILGSYIIPQSSSSIFLNRIDFLKDRIQKEGVEELIIALNTTTEGQASALYIKDSLKNIVPKISRIAFGVPLGADIDYIDEFTLSYALKGRTPIDGK
ncbi:MAG: recombination mediator RecR [Elusimicrobiota bacterium]